jgi:hypothetical protein
MTARNDRRRELRRNVGGLVLLVVLMGAIVALRIWV